MLPAIRKGEKWYAVLKAGTQIGAREVAKLVSDETTLNRKDAEMESTSSKKSCSACF